MTDVDVYHALDPLGLFESLDERELGGRVAVAFEDPTWPKSARRMIRARANRALGLPAVAEHGRPSACQDYD